MTAPLCCCPRPGQSTDSVPSGLLFVGTRDFTTSGGSRFHDVIFRCPCGGRWVMNYMFGAYLWSRGVKRKSWWRRR